MPPTTLPQEPQHPDEAAARPEPMLDHSGGNHAGDDHGGGDGNSGDGNGGDGNGGDGNGGLGGHGNPGPGRGWVTVATFWSGVEAHLARLKLEDAQVPCVLADEHLSATHCFVLATGGVKLQVPAELARLAREVLDAGRRNGALAGADEGDGHEPGGMGATPAELPAVMLRRPTVIGHFRDEVEATMSAAVLEEQGIACEVLMPPRRGLMSRRPIVLQVAGPDVDEARSLLADTPAKAALLAAAAEGDTGRGHLNDDLDDDSDVSLICPRCLSLQVRRLQWVVPLLVGVLLITAVLAAGKLGLLALGIAVVGWTIALLVRPANRCLDCGHRWRDD